MGTTSLLRPGVSLRRAADRHQTRIGWLHEPSEVLIWEMHASLGPAGG